MLNGVPSLLHYIRQRKTDSPVTTAVRGRGPGVSTLKIDDCQQGRHRQPTSSPVCENHGMLSNLMTVLHVLYQLRALLREI